MTNLEIKKTQNVEPLIIEKGLKSLDEAQKNYDEAQTELFKMSHKTFRTSEDYLEFEEKIVTFNKTGKKLNYIINLFREIKEFLQS